MSDKQETCSEQELARRFSLMRREDALQAPDFPQAAVLAAREPVIGGWRVTSTLPKIAAAALVVAAILLLHEPAPQDPGELYVTIMRANSIDTDSLLSASVGTLPGMASVPDVIELDTAADAAWDIH